jgi:hypothetical protein
MNMASQDTPATSNTLLDPKILRITEAGGCENSDRKRNVIAGSEAVEPASSMKARCDKPIFGSTSLHGVVATLRGRRSVGHGCRLMNLNMPFHIQVPTE